MSILKQPSTGTICLLALSIDKSAREEASSSLSFDTLGLLRIKASSFRDRTGDGDFPLRFTWGGCTL